MGVLLTLCPGALETLMGASRTGLQRATHPIQSPRAAAGVLNKQDRKDDPTLRNCRQASLLLGVQRLLGVFWRMTGLGILSQATQGGGGHEGLHRLLQGPGQSKDGHSRPQQCAQ